MTWLVVAGLWLFGWIVGSRFNFSYKERFILSGGVGYALTAVGLQVLWLTGIPFLWLSALWWLLLGGALGWLIIEWKFKRAQLWEVLRQFLDHCQDTLEEVSLSWKKWPLFLMSAISFFSLAIMVFWAIAVRPVTWDNLTLYDARARLLAEGMSLTALSQQFSGEADAQGYDFIHPFGSSVVSALAYQVHGDWVAVVQLPLLLSVLCLPLLLWKSWSARSLFWLLLTTSRIIFERAVEGYAAWPAFLLWVLSLGCFFLWFQQKKRYEWFVPMSLFLASAQTMRVFEPFWPLLGVFCFGLFAREKKMWKLLVQWQALPWFVCFQWLVVQHFTLQKLPVLVAGVAKPWSLSPEWFTLFWQNIIVQRDFWAFGIMLLFLLAVKPWALFDRTIRVFGTLAFFWLGLLIAGLTYFILSSPDTATEFARSWPRASIPLVALVLLLCSQIISLPRLWKKERDFVTLQK